MSDRNVFVCILATESPAVPSHIANCWGCKKRVWISPGTLKAWERIGGEILCVDCATPIMQEEGHEIRIAEEIAREMVEYASRMN